MNVDNHSPAPPRVVLVLREDLPANLAANAAAVLGATIGVRLDLPVGAEGTDDSGTRFAGIVTTPIPVLSAPAAVLTQLFGAVTADASLTAACLTEVARRARTYEGYLEALAATTAAETDLVGLGIAGPRNRVTKLTKRLPLLGHRPDRELDS